MFHLPWFVSLAGAALLGACSPDAAEQLPPADLTGTAAPQVLLPTPNLALGKPAQQSSFYLGGGGEPSLAVDGNTDGDFWDGSFTHTVLQSQQTQPWWQVDLQASHLISNVVLYNRTDCCSDRLQNFRVRHVLLWPLRGGRDRAPGGVRRGVWLREYVNPLTGMASCPDGFKAVQILGTSGVDYPVFFCYRKQ
ncbi:galactose-binding domain-containing protein [Myxococcus vastator]|uniref:galactose-binding domain-containing protein n=1 Tax=Myxococcus vastator TaxID=2709664 RepID=UPI0013D06A23|nr:discoidin domain-containing protein [Myxococcus vastator]